MLKPLSRKTLEKKYAELGLSQSQIDLLHTYFLCFAHLYGVIPLKEAWKIFRHYEGIAVHKSDFVAFSGVVQREAGLPYAIYESNEIYSEESNDPLERMIVHNKLVSSGYGKFRCVYVTAERQANLPYYLPDKQILQSFTEDRFYLTPYGREMKSFVERLKTNGIRKDYSGCVKGEITDINGNSVKGKRLSECIFYTSCEEFDLEYFKSPAKLQKMREAFHIPVSEKILQKIEEYMMAGSFYREDSPAEEVDYLIQFLDGDCGVLLSEKEYMRFIELFMELNNHSNLWRNSGWSPDELFKKSAHQMPSTISIGPNMKKMFDSGELDREEFEKKLAQMGIRLSDE